MFNNRIIYFIAMSLLLLFIGTFIFAQTKDKANIKATPLVLQTKPQTDLQKAEIDQLIKSLPKKRQKTFKAVSAIMAKQLLENMQSNKDKRTKENDALEIVSAGMEKTAIITNAIDDQTLIQQTQAAVSYGLQVFVFQLEVKLAANNHIKEILREEITALKDIIYDWSGEIIVREVTYRSYIQLADGSYEIVEKTSVMSQEQVIALIEEMEVMLASLGEDSEELMLRLQDAMNEQARVMQILSNIMKNMHDTAKAIIQNLK